MVGLMLDGTVTVKPIVVEPRAVSPLYVVRVAVAVADAESVM